MHFYIMTLFPEMVMQGLCTSIIGRAVEKGILSIDAVNIRDYAFNKHNSVDDYPYGGGAGMLMQAEPVYQAYQAVKEKISAAGPKPSSGGEETADVRGRAEEGKTPRVVCLSPQGKTFNQKMAEEFAAEEELVFLCGHYEGIDGDRDGLCVDRGLYPDGRGASGYDHGGCNLASGAWGPSQRCIGRVRELPG